MLEDTNDAILGGFYIRRVSSPEMAAINRTRRAMRDEENKENTPPSANVGSSAAWLRRQRMNMSPLPPWYPRTPLRDISVIYNALQRRRLREEAARAAAKKENDRRAKSSTTVNLLINSKELIPLQNGGCNAAGSSHSTPSTNAITIANCINAEAEEIEKKLSKSIDQIEKMIRKAYNLNVKKNSKEELHRKRIKTLMSMR